MVGGGQVKLDYGQRSRRKHSSGAVLTEVIISFALTALLLSSAIFVITAGIRGFQRLRAGARANLVSELLLDKISGEIAAAEPGSTASGSNWSFLVGDAQENISAVSGAPAIPAAAWIAFEDRYGIPAAIYAAERDDSAERGHGYLYIRYYTDGEENAGIDEDICWHFDPKVYMGFRINRLLFSRPEPERRNVFRIDLELEHEQTGWKHASYCYIRNMNLRDDSRAVLTEQGAMEPEAVEAWLKEEEMQ